MSISERVPRKLHVCADGESIGHEYWYADGKRIGYHGHKNGESILGYASARGAEDVSYAFPFNTGHIFSRDERLIVGDGFSEGKYIRLWRLTEDGYEEPRALCAHNCSFKRQRAHVHPRLTDDGRRVLYTSDETGYEQLYLAEIPENIESLPKLSRLWNK
jgi:oligogalacturonide lyase